MPWPFLIIPALLLPFGLWLAVRAPRLADAYMAKWGGHWLHRRAGPERTRASILGLAQMLGGMLFVISLLGLLVNTGVLGRID